MSIELKNQIESALKSFDSANLHDSAIKLLNTLGYKSGRTLDAGHSPEEFLEMLKSHSTDFQENRFKEKSLFCEWKSASFLFQLTDEDIGSQLGLFASSKVDSNFLKSYVFFAVSLKGNEYPHGKFANIARQINRVFPMPVMIIIQYGDKLTLAIINRRQDKRKHLDRDVLEKVTLIKDIDLRIPHRAHVEILSDFSIRKIQDKPIASFDELHNIWSEILNVEELNKRFYKRIQEWFFWAAKNVQFPYGGIDDVDLRNRTALIRMLTRIVFCWFAKEKGLIPVTLFDDLTIKKVLKEFDKLSLTDGSFYKAILQNLFFPTLSVPLDQREFRNGRRYKGNNKHYMRHEFFRHEELFKDSDDLGRLFSDIPFLNGGLFECLDSGTCKEDEIRVDGFSDLAKNQPLVPNVLFFGKGIETDLSDSYGSEKKDSVNVDGLFPILNAYKFTIAENTPIEEEIALDPELLGRIFENLLAEYNPETKLTARKQTGSFYTPRNVVDYMVDTSLKAYLMQILCPKFSLAQEDANAGLDILFNYTEKEHPFNEKEKLVLVDAIYDIKILDPACGSGAFPMGMLHKLLYVLERLDLDHERWKERILDETPAEMREETRNLLERSSADHNWKLGLILHSIYGVDIQPIAVQIAKLRCFISLLVDSPVDEKEENKGVPALPNLDFKFVAANTLIKAPSEIERDGDELKLEDPFFKKFTRATDAYFFVRDPEEKRKMRKNIEVLIDEKIKEKENSLTAYREKEAFIKKHDKGEERHKENIRRAMVKEADNIQEGEREIEMWKSYRNIFSFRNEPVQFFDIKYFFPEAKDGFDIVLGNPPYVRADSNSNQMDFRRQLENSGDYETLWEKWDLFIPFIERGYKLLKANGITTMIVSDAFCHSKYAQKSQNWFLENSRILRLDFLSKIQIFEAAVHNIVYFFQKADGTQNQPERRLHEQEFGKVKLLATDIQPKLTYRAFFPEDSTTQIFNKPTLRLEEICYISVGMVIHADEKKAHGAFLTDELISYTKDKLHPKAFVEGKNLEKWFFPKNSYLEWGTKRAPHLFRRPTFPELYDHLEKLMLPMVGDIRAAYDDKQLTCNHGIFVCVPWSLLSGVRNNSLKKTARYADEEPPRPDLPNREKLEKTSKKFAVKYLLAVMNSSTAREFLRAHRRNNIQLYPDDWKALPIPISTQKQQEAIIKLVDKILEAKRSCPPSDISEFEKQIDQLVYELYGITPEEVAMVEGSTLRKDETKFMEG